jgi:hypothetical protein
MGFNPALKVLKPEIGLNLEIVSTCHAEGVSNFKLCKCWDFLSIG